MAVYSDKAALSPQNLARPELLELTPYQSARRIVAAAGGRGDIWLNANESAVAVPMALQTSEFNRYPEPQPEAVVSAYAAYSGADEDQILVTRGGDEGIELLVRTFCRPGKDAVLQYPPTYGMYSVSAQTNGAAVIDLVTAPDRDWVPDAAQTAEALDGHPEIKLVFACSPGNPTGTLVPEAVLRKLAELTLGRALLVIDEAYIEFSPANTALGLLKEFPHVVLIRTLSKAFALAGIRCGFLLSSPGVIGVLKKVIAPYPVPTPVADLARQALAPESVRAMRQRSADTVLRRSSLEVALEDLPCVEAVYPSASNFVLVEFKDGPAVFRALWDQGIILRDQSRQPTLAGCIRITVGTEEENSELLKALEKIGSPS